ncbi:protein HIRA [Copidosoma floridanum]|uniref:protein HIRA n=1 Tax=Copidosoma floridanum TaxID=29053 RepID=UPI0006C93CEB|nr:protein HIRA [Copidosoma floridanum]
MRLVKPNWVTHDGSPIYSVDIHPDGKRFATGGQGGDSGRVVIWNLEPVLNEEAENNSNIPKMLCQMDNHFACVNCVRWNSSGMLASAGDDKLIMLWRLAVGVGVSTLFGAKAGVETWRCKSTLRSHSGDILDLAWAPHNPWLASASVDNTVIVWDTSKATIVAILKGHSGLVKGVAWDPIGKYLATQSDDKTLRVWRTNDWGQESLITEPFEECGSTTHVLRLSWSPDGQYLVSAHAMNGGGPTAQIIDREGWKQDKDYVGHRKAVTCVKFNNNIMQKPTNRGEKNEEKKTMRFCCVAIGSRDRSISIWSTPLKRPLVVINEVFLSSVLDLSWSSCGMRLCACSMDGTVVFMEFSSEELGCPLDSVEVMNMKERMYGKIAQGGCTIIETPELLLRQNSVPVPSAVPANPVTTESLSVSQSFTNCVKSILPNSVVQSPVKAPIDKQIETRMSNGKRRITPMFVPPPPETLDSEPGKSVPTEPFSSTSQAKSTIVIERRDEVVRPPQSNVSNISSFSRIEEPSTSAATTSGPALTLKRKDPKSSTTTTTDNDAESQSKKAKSIPVERNGHPVLFPSLKPKAPISLHTGHYTVTVNSDHNLYHMQVYEETSTERLWDQYFGYGVTGLASTTAIVAVSLEDGSVHIFYTTKGARATPPLAPPSPIARLVAAGNMVMVISCYGDVRVWEITQSACRLICSTSAAHLVTPGMSILNCTLYNGMPHLAFTNARAYVYHIEMGTWLLIGDSQDPVWRWSAMNALHNPVVMGNRKANGPVAVLQEGLNLVAGMVMPPLKNPNSIPCITSYLEQQVLVSKILGSSHEYVHWLLAFATFLVTHDGLESRLRIILDELLGPAHSTAHKSTWDPDILGVKKHALLEDILKIMSSNLRWQRLYVEYNEQLEEIKKL